MPDKSYAEYLASDRENHKRIMAKYGIGPVPKSFNGDTSLLSGEPVTVVEAPPVYKPELAREVPAPAAAAPVIQLALL